LVEFYETGESQLFNVRDDIREQHDLSPSNAAKKRELSNLLGEWRRSAHAQMPVPRPAP
jgi:hypothetical protein